MFFNLKLPDDIFLYWLMFFFVIMNKKNKKQKQKQKQTEEYHNYQMFVATNYDHSDWIQGFFDVNK